MKSLASLFQGVPLVHFPVSSSVAHERFELRHYPSSVILATLQQPWRFVHSYTLGTDTVEKFIRAQNWVDRPKQHTHNTCVVLTRTKDYRGSLLNEDGTFPTDNHATICWMTLHEKLHLFIYLLNTPKKQLRPQGPILKQLLPLLFALKSCDWITDADLPNEEALRDKAKRTHIINWISYAMEGTFALPHDTNPVDLSSHQVMLYTGHIVMVMTEKALAAPEEYMHSIITWLKECMTVYHVDYWSLMHHVDSVFNRQRYDKWKRPERAALLDTLQKAVKDVLFALVLGNSDKEAKVGAQGHTYSNNPKPIADRYQWLHRLPTSSDGRPALRVATNPVQWTSFHTLEFEGALQCNYIALEQLEACSEVGWVFMVMPKASALQVQRVLQHYSHLWKPLYEREPKVIDFFHQREPVAIVAWNPTALYQLQCLSVCNAASLNTSNDVAYHYALPLGRLLNWKQEPSSACYNRLLDQYIRGIYILLGVNTLTDCVDNLAQAYVRGVEIQHLDLHPLHINDLYVRLLRYLFIDSRRKHPHEVPYSYLVSEIEPRNVKMVMLSLLTPHCYHAIHCHDTETIMRSHQAVYGLLNRFVALNTPPVSVTLPWHHVRTSKAQPSSAVLCHDQTTLNDPKWYVMSPTKYVEFLEHALDEAIAPGALWEVITKMRSILPCSTQHLQRVFNNTPYPPDWNALTTFVPREQQQYVPTPHTPPVITTPDSPIEPLSPQLDEMDAPSLNIDAFELTIQKIVIVTMHMLLTGVTDFQTLLPTHSIAEAYIKDTSDTYTNTETALFSDCTVPIVVRDSSTRTIGSLLDSFLLSDVFLPCTGSPVASWYESLAAADPPMDLQYLQRVQQKHPNTVNSVNLATPPGLTINSRKRTKVNSPSGTATVLSPIHRLNLHLNSDPFVDVTRQAAPYSPGQKRAVTPRTYDPTEPSLEALSHHPTTKRKHALQSPRHR